METGKGMINTLMLLSTLTALVLFCWQDPCRRKKGLHKKTVKKRYTTGHSQD